MTEGDARAVANEIVRAVAELPDRTSPDDWPEAMLVTDDELRDIVTAAFAIYAETVAAQRVAEERAITSDLHVGYQRLRADREALREALRLMVALFDHRTALPSVTAADVAAVKNCLAFARAALTVTPEAELARGAAAGAAEVLRALTMTDDEAGRWWWLSLAGVGNWPERSPERWRSMPEEMRAVFIRTGQAALIRLRDRHRATAATQRHPAPDAEGNAPAGPPHADDLLRHHHAEQARQGRT